MPVKGVGVQVPPRTQKPRAFSPIRHPLEHAAVRSPAPGRIHRPAWSSGASSSRMGGESPTRSLSRHLRWRHCRAHRGRPCLPHPGEAAVTARHIAPVIPPSAVPAARRHARSAAGRALPLARPVRSVPQDVVYGIARIDASGRICERAIITALGWADGDRLTLTADAGVVTARRDPGGMITLPRRAYIAIPAALRRRCGLRARRPGAAGRAPRRGRPRRLLPRRGGPGHPRPRRVSRTRKEKSHDHHPGLPGRAPAGRRGRGAADPEVGWACPRTT